MLSPYRLSLLLRVVDLLETLIFVDHIRNYQSRNGGVTNKLHTSAVECSWP
jgi:hypothetical protein